MCEPQAHSLFPLSRWQLCAPLDSVSAYDSYASVNSLINLLANAFLHETLDSGRPRIHDYRHALSATGRAGTTLMGRQRGAVHYYGAIKTT
ncbi:rpiR-family transcriptional regulatory protein [Klebsiella pneumoniae]|uniref:RpiR-family transcriptional regulatory protein n=1 Tax=Klebsiella pneumoniae TaxID=573 RepID=A0A2X1QJL8_KLEPN|nr:rpiR-family transcriptional regulatory protein [Klebsiella pneumoniae]